jgi:LuxR family quorum sensing-dependent transcriptional regulator
MERYKGHVAKGRAMDGLALAAMEFLSRAEKSTKVADLVDDYSSLVRRFGVTHYIIAGLPSHGEDPESLIVVNKWPKEWLDRYREENYFYADPVTQWSFSQPRPFTWQAARENCEATARAKQIEGEARELHLVDGIGFPVVGPNRFQAVVSLATDTSCDLSPEHRWLLYAASTACQVQALEMLRPEDAMSPPLPRLTDRERDVLQWLAHGKTKWEVSTILGISENTVDTHMRHVRGKLNTSNTAQAVAEAIHRHEIQI